MAETIYQKLKQVQSELKAPKGQFNSFGKYKYRSCEDILEAVKPILAKHDCVIILSDTVINLGDNRFYVKAIATFVDAATGEKVENSAFAREEEQKKGMDGSQITGTASSYARKYALNDLLLIDDTKDADTDEFKNQNDKKSEPVQQTETSGPAYPERKVIISTIEKHYPVGKSRDALLAFLKAESLDKATDAQLQAVYNKVAAK